MKALPTQERALKKRAALLAAAIDEFADAGFDNATAKTIAARAGVATGTFYQYFENKQDILCVIANERFRQLQDRIKLFQPQRVDQATTGVQESSEIQRLFAEVLDFVYDFHAQDPELHQVLEQRRGVDTELGKIMDRGEGVLRERVLRFVQSFNVELPEVVADNLYAMAEGIVHRHVFRALDTDKEDVIRTGADMLAAYFVSI